MAPEIQADLDLSPAGFGLLSSCFFLAFGFAQIPVGIAFDRYGVGGPTRLLMTLGVLSAVLFVCAPGGLTAMVAQAGLGLACAPIFMGLMHYAAEVLPPDRYVPFVSRTNALGMLGALCATAPLGWVIQGIGWRSSMAIAALVFAVVTLGVWRSVQDRGQAREHSESPAQMVQASLGLLALLATIGVLHPLVMSHARSLLKPSLRGRGLGLLNGFVFLGSAFASWTYGLIAADGLHRGLSDASIYSGIFAFSAALMLVGGLAYAFSPRRSFQD